MDTNLEKQHAIEQLKNLIEEVENDFQTNDIISWQQLFCLYFCLISLGEDIPEDLTKRISDCGLAAYTWILNESMPSEEIKKIGPEGMKDPVRRGILPLCAFFETGKGRGQSQIMMDGLRAIASMDYVQTLLNKEKR